MVSIMCLHIAGSLLETFHYFTSEYCWRWQAILDQSVIESLHLPRATKRLPPCLRNAIGRCLDHRLLNDSWCLSAVTDAWTVGGRWNAGIAGPPVRRPYSIRKQVIRKVPARDGRTACRRKQDPARRAFRCLCIGSGKSWYKYG